ncbi:MAG: hypothetical protein HY544_04235 [Candidatus Diapherotrites archaeon]|uniref:HD domain-containing protein n=1 Tax=Candidatus Iainarchaeum sp. TaxID=3101447 RepID=A0A8T3YN40_9ARCH|nr:hypothetical protein [Candidatus Diapherotrites archaeon]
MKIPSMSECMAIMREYDVPENVMAHTEAVRRIANFLAEKISARGNDVDSKLVDRAALMHDFLKVHCIRNKCRHAHEAGRVLAERGYPEFGEAVKQHGLEEVLVFGQKTRLEAKIVWYADKRVNHDKVVSLAERYAYLKSRYGSASGKKMAEIVSTQVPAIELERELFALAGIGKDFSAADISARKGAE